MRTVITAATSGPRTPSVRVSASTTAISLVDATYRYDASSGVDAVTLAIAPGSHTALMGPNGSGKSTVLALAAGILSPSSGTVRRGVRAALVPQRSDVNDRMPITVRETVAMGRWADRGAWRPLRRHDRQIIDECIDRLGLGALASRRLGSLSGGQRQRALLAQALSQHAGLLLLDEPESGLDAEAREVIGAVIRDEVSRGTAVVVATHELRTARAAERVVLMNAGRVVADGAAPDILDGAALARMYFA